MGHLGRRAACILGTLLLALTAVGSLAGSAAATTNQSPTIALRSSRPRVLRGSQVRLYGHVNNPPIGSVVKLYQWPYPYRRAKYVATATPGGSGAFSFKVSPHLNTRYTAVLTNTYAVAGLTIGVFYPLHVKVKALPLGRAGITIIVHHPRGFPWGDAKTRWFYETSGEHQFHQVASTTSHKLSDTAVALHTVNTLPAGGFQWRVCFHAPKVHAIANTDRPPGCTGRGYEGHASLPVGYPTPAAIGRAAAYLRNRAGIHGFAVVDSEGRESGLNVNETFQTASVIKAMLLVAYLRLKQSRGQHTITSYDRSILDPMIEVSDNNAATRCWQIVGDARLYALARAAHMTHFSIVGIWANARISPGDQARYFFEMDSLIPHEFVGYARYLLSHIVSYESWGIPAVARPRGYQVFFKGGWIPPYLVHQVARLEGHGKRFSIAVMTDSDPSFTYGVDTIQGVASILTG